MSWLLDFGNKLKAYGLAILACVAGALYILYKRATAKNESLTRENSDLHSANESALKAMQEKQRNDEALRKANEGINKLNPKYHYSDSDK